MNSFNYSSIFLDSLKSAPAFKKRNKPANTIKQYGDAGYKPSTGKGVGY
jgi:hypothetical protein